MQFAWKDLRVEMTAEYQKQDIWKQIPKTAFTEEGFQFETEDGRYYGTWKQERKERKTGSKEEKGASWRFSIGFTVSYETQLRLRFSMPGQ